MMFQSPKSGKFESNMKKVYKDLSVYTAFQSPKSGKFESNQRCKLVTPQAWLRWFQSPKSGKFESNFSLTLKKALSLAVSIP